MLGQARRRCATLSVKVAPGFHVAAASRGQVGVAVAKLVMGQTSRPAASKALAVSEEGEVVTVGAEEEEIRVKAKVVMAVLAPVGE